MPNYNFREIERCLAEIREGRQPTRHNAVVGIITEKIDLNTSLGQLVFVVLAAVAQLERDLIAERVRNGLANAKAKGVRIGRERKRNSVLIESLLDAGLSYREIARISKCSHGSVHAQLVALRQRRGIAIPSKKNFERILFEEALLRNVSTASS